MAADVACGNQQNRARNQKIIQNGYQGQKSLDCYKSKEESTDSQHEFQ